jgi:hypothetical protein
VKPIYSTLFSTMVVITFAMSVCAQTSSTTPIVIQTQPAHKDFVDYSLATVQLATLIALVIYVIKTWQIAAASQRSAQLSEGILSEMHATRLQEIAPYVIVYFDMPYSNDWVMYLVVKNTGKTIAKNIQFKVDPPLVTGFTNTGEGTKPFDVYFLREGISLLAPGQEIRTPFDAHSTLNRENLPTIYKVEVTYADGLQPNRTASEHVLDVSIFNDLSVLQKKGEEDLIKAVETIASSNKELQRQATKIANSLLRGIWINNPEMLSTSREVDSRERWVAGVTAKLGEICSVWKNVHAGDFGRPFRLSLDELQSRLGTFASHLLLITSHATPGVSPEVKESLLEIVTGLYKLSQAPFYMDGGKSGQEFNSSGDRVTELAERIIERLMTPTSYNENSEAPQAQNDGPSQRSSEDLDR